MNEIGLTILVTGATGRQGGAVARHLLRAGWPVRALTRDPDRPAARALREQGADVVQGDLEDSASLAEALRGVYGVFAALDCWTHGCEAEVRQGKNLAIAARAAQVEHFVYSSVGGADRKTGVPHFESKWEVERYLRALRLPATVLRPAFFMENLQAPELRAAIAAGTLPLALRSDKPLQMIAVDDIGAIVALAFRDGEDFMGKAMEVAGDEITMPAAADTFSRVTGRPVLCRPLPLEQVRQEAGDDIAAQFRWFNDAGYRANLTLLRALHPRLMTLETWLRRGGDWADAGGRGGKTDEAVSRSQ